MGGLIFFHQIKKIIFILIIRKYQYCILMKVFKKIGRKTFGIEENFNIIALKESIEFKALKITILKDHKKTQNII